MVQLSFADDLLLFCRGDYVSVKMLYQCFLEFSQASGLIAKQKKFPLYFGGVQEDIQQEILNMLGFTKGTLPVRYL